MPAIKVGSRVTWRTGSGFSSRNTHGTVARISATNAWVRENGRGEERVLLRRLSLMSEREIELADWKSRRPASQYAWARETTRGGSEIRVEFIGPASKIPELRAEIDALVAWLAEEPNP